MERQEIHCHECNSYVRFDLDLSLNGNHVLNCPKCGHEHCRVVVNGRITGERWDSRNGPTIRITSSTTATTAFWGGASAGTASTFTAQLWLDTTTFS